MVLSEPYTQLSQRIVSLRWKLSTVHVPLSISGERRSHRERALSSGRAHVPHVPASYCGGEDSHSGTSHLNNKHIHYAFDKRTRITRYIFFIDDLFHACSVSIVSSFLCPSLFLGVGQRSRHPICDAPI